jgi:endonuclease/exonuclease/phosphatase family metal-dependent hydrolase
MRRALICVLILLSACAVPGPAPSAVGSAEVRVLVWNVWHGGNDVDGGPEKIRDLVVQTGADVVLMQESYDIEGDRPTTGRWLAQELGWNAFQGESPHLCVVSRFAIDETFFHHPWHGVGARLIDPEGRAFVAWSIWLDYRAYLPWQLRDEPEISDDDLLAAEDVLSSRLPQARALLADLDARGHLGSEVPVLVGGDWNTPSHLDWTVDTARVYRHRRGARLPVSAAMQDEGFVDAFRVVHPNPVQQPGITWSPLFRVTGDGKAQGFERIDRLYVRNPASAGSGWKLEPRAARVLPEIWEDDAIPVRERQFPSDHGAVLLELEWVPVGR